jgi:hypothetical protein
MVAVSLLCFVPVPFAGASPKPTYHQNYAFPPTAPTTVTTTPSSIAGGGFENTIAQDPTDSSVLAVGGDVSGIELSRNGGETWTPTNDGFLASDAELTDAALHVASVAFDSNGNLWAALGNGSVGSEIWKLTSAEISSTTPTWSQVASALSFTVDGTNGNGSWSDATRPTGNLLTFGSGDQVYLATEEGIVSRVSSTWGVTTPSSFWGSSGFYENVIPTSLTLDPADNSYALMTTEEIGSSTEPVGLFVIQNMGTTSPSVDCQLTPPYDSDTSTDPAQEVVAIEEDTGSPAYGAYIAFGSDGLLRLKLPANSNDPCASMGGATWANAPLIDPTGSGSPTGATDCAADGFNAVAAVGTSVGAEVWGGCGSSATTGPSNTMPYNNELWRVKISLASGFTKTVEGIAGGGASSGSASLTPEYPYMSSSVDWWHIENPPPVPYNPPNVSTVTAELGNSTYFPSQIVESSDTDTVWVAGRAGVWYSTNAEPSVAMSSVLFTPDVSGLATTFDYDVTGSTTSADAAVGDHDWQALLSRTRLNTSASSSYGAVDQNPNGNPVLAVGYLPVSSGHPPLLAGDSEGYVSYNPDPDSSTTGSCGSMNNCWVTLRQLPGGQPVMAVTAGYDSGDVVILAASGYQSNTATGIYVMDCGTASITDCKSSMSWSLGINALGVNTDFGTSVANQQTMSFYWELGSSGGRNSGANVYLYDGSTGLWASSMYGSATSWSNVLGTVEVPVGSVPTQEQGYVGYMAGADQTAEPNALYISNGLNLYDIADASTCPSLCLYTIMYAFNGGVNGVPGPVQVDNSGDAFVVDSSLDTGTSALEELPYGSGTWSAVQDSAFEESVLSPSAMGVSDQACPELYFSATGQGVNVASGSC